MEPSTAEPSFLSTRRGKLTLALVCLAGFLDFVDTTIVNLALPSIRHGLGGLLLLVYALVNVARVGWGSTRTVAELASAAMLLAAFAWPAVHSSSPRL
jgi:hypothetical protein